MTSNNSSSCRHPDKRPEEEREEATLRFQEISAAYQRLTQPEESDDEDEGYGMDAEETMAAFFSFFEFMQQAFEERSFGERSRPRGGQSRPQGRGGGRGNGRGGGGIFVQTPFGSVRVDVTTSGG